MATASEGHRAHLGPRHRKATGRTWGRGINCRRLRVAGGIDGDWQRCTARLLRLDLVQQDKLQLKAHVDAGDAVRARELQRLPQSVARAALPGPICKYGEGRERGR